MLQFEHSWSSGQANEQATLNLKPISFSVERTDLKKIPYSMNNFIHCLQVAVLFLVDFCRLGSHTRAHKVTCKQEALSYFQILQLWLGFTNTGIRHDYDSLRRSVSMHQYPFLFFVFPAACVFYLSQVFTNANNPAYICFLILSLITENIICKSGGRYKNIWFL